MIWPFQDIVDFMNSFDDDSTEDCARSPIPSPSPGGSNESPPQSKDTLQVDCADQVQSHTNYGSPRSISQSPTGDINSNCSLEHSPPFSKSSGGSSQTPTSSSSKRRISPAEIPPPRPKRTERRPLPCSEDNCNQILTCPYDLRRHLDDVHGQCQYVYRCDEPSCGRVRSRKDKVNEHCDKMGHQSHGFSRVYVGDGQNGEVLEAMRRQRDKRKGRRQRSSDVSFGR